MNPKKILIVDDDFAIANIYQNKFRVEGYAAEVASDGARALEMLGRAPVDLVLLDLGLPGMNGVEVLKQIRSRPETQAVPVVVFSNTYLSSLMQAAWRAGATKCVSKASCTPRDLLGIVAKLFAAGGDGPQPAYGSIPFIFPVPAAGVGGAIPMKLEAELQAELLSAFLAGAPQTIHLMRNRYHTFLKPDQENLRLANLDGLCRLSRSLTGAAGVVGFKTLARIASALEAFLKELNARPADITPSTIRTIAQAVDKLALLIGHAGSLTGAVNPTEAPLILVVDDEAVSREIIVRAVAKAGLRAMSLDNSSLALEVLEQNHFDLVFLDIKMPKPDGIEVCERLRKMPLNRTTPVIFVTAKAEFEGRVKSNLSGGSDFIAKPIAVLELAVKALTWLYNDDLKPLALAGGNVLDS